MKNKLVSFDKEAPTAWLTLIIMVAGFGIFINNALANDHELEQTTSQEETRIEEKQEGRPARIITTTEYDAQQAKAAILADLRHCESSNYDYAVGDGGASIGPFQWQKATFEDKIGHKVTYEYYYDYVTDYERIYKLTKEVFFEQDEWWRWENCSYKIGYVN
tara:strand:+ start:605 stop:1090 length:486 start_codon:yes stop_codon:yes gene_type:complete